MFLHNDRKLFQSVIQEITDDTGVDAALIEKDYYVTLVLKRLVEKEPLLIFKGGTCLSKCYKLIERFSEDIDINLENVNSQTQSRKKQMKDHIDDTVREFGFELLNPQDIASGRSHNGYKIGYPTLYQGIAFPNMVLVKTMFLVDTFPTQRMEAGSLVYDHLVQSGDYAAIAEYGLIPFEVTVQSLERTFVDKVFALGTHYINDRMYWQSRHLYDLYKILPHIKLNKDMENLFDEVRVAWKSRKGNQNWTAAEDVANFPKLLKEIITTEAYRSDYENVTTKLLYEQVPYEDTIRSLKKIVSEMEGGSAM
ncbi:MAG: nucleotidyl transferase AbiEii/AbiGii toxin family protein [Clostridiaceae bacterium]|jgi:predicted nucleotidyltransferase component of viral defense system|nr:nucleotidyl transferase AbiEii/AbiGii toxin family protein [Clostridiaceae bacterium]